MDNQEEKYGEEGYEEGGEKHRRGPVIIILALFLLFIVVMMSVPYYSVRLDPSPKHIPSLKELNASRLAVNVNLSKFATRSRMGNPYTAKITPSDPVVKRTADIIAEGCPSASRVCDAKGMFYFVKEKISYVNDPVDREYVKYPRETLFTGNGDCDDKAVLLSSLLEAVGIRTRLVFVPRHVYVEAELPKALSHYKNKEGWVSLDATCESCSFGEVSYTYSSLPKHYS